MKKVLTGMFLIVLVAGFTSCKKIVDAIFNGTDVKAPEVVIPIPAIPIVLPAEGPGITTKTSFNLDSAIKANTGGVFDASYVKSIKIKEIKIDLRDADALNNLSNFKTARVTLVSNSNQTPVEILNTSFEDVPLTTKTITTNSVELISYLRGSELSYTMYGTMRRPTTKPLTFVTVATLRVE